MTEKKEGDPHPRTPPILYGLVLFTILFLTLSTSYSANYSPYNIIVTPDYVSCTAFCSCGMGTYSYQTHAFVNYCPVCKHYGTLGMTKYPLYEGHWTCSHCDCDYCAQCGKECMPTSLYLLPYQNKTSKGEGAPSYKPTLTRAQVMDGVKRCNVFYKINHRNPNYVSYGSKRVYWDVFLKEMKYYNLKTNF